MEKSRVTGPMSSCAFSTAACAAKKRWCRADLGPPNPTAPGRREDAPAYDAHRRARRLVAPRTDDIGLMSFPCAAD